MVQTYHNYLDIAKLTSGTGVFSYTESGVPGLNTSYPILRNFQNSLLMRRNSQDEIVISPNQRRRATSQGW